MKLTNLGSIALALGVVVGLAGCQTAGKGGSAGSRPAVAVDVAANIADFSVEKVAVLSFANTSGDKEADEARRFVHIALSQANKFFVTKESSLARDAARNGVEEQHKRLVEVWEKRRTINTPDLIAVCEASGHDALMAVEVSIWSEQKVDKFQEGSSTTSVEMKMHLYAADGTLLWSGSSMKVGHSRPYSPEMNMRATQDGEAILNEGAVPDPPPIEPLAQELADEIVATIPVSKAGA